MNLPLCFSPVEMLVSEEGEQQELKGYLKSYLTSETSDTSHLIHLFIYDDTH